MTNRQRLDETIDYYFERWKSSQHYQYRPCPLCMDLSCCDCLLGQFKPRCLALVAELDIGYDEEEKLRHLLQLRLYLYGNVKRWTE